ncbi:hypothetical protein ACQSGA_07655 [Salmonella enterica]|uniref:hypothetical protein n=1 Tax=Salmonella enterica TaxID=28901 RepID=UPI003D315881
MTTITNSKLTDETLSAWKTEAMISLGETPKDCRDYSHHEAILALVTELQERRKADNQEPAGYHVIKECGKIGCSVATLEEAEKTRDFWNKKWTIRPYFYSAPPVQETGVYKDMLNIIGLLENNEWAEHCTSTVLGSLLESEITRLVGKGQPAPVVPDECPDELLAFCEQVIDSRITANAKADELWNACRAAMLQGSQPVSNRDELSSPVIPDGYALVPIVPTEDMVINGFESEPDPHFSDEKVWAEYEALSGCRRAARRAELCWAAMIKAAPKPEGNNG